MSTRDEIAGLSHGVDPLEAVAREATEGPASLRGTVLDPAVLGRVLSEMYRADLAAPGAPASPGGVQGLAPAPTASPAGVPSFAPASPAGLQSLAPGATSFALPSAAAPSLSSTPAASASSLPSSSRVPFEAPGIPLLALGLDASVGTSIPGSLATRSGTPQARPGIGGLDQAGASVPSTPSALASGFDRVRDQSTPYFLELAGPPAAIAPAADTSRPLEVPAPSPASHEALDVGRVRAEFPILQERVNGHPLVWLDNAATTQKPRAVIDRISSFYEHENSNIHRAAHALAARATDAYESAREKVRRFLGAASRDDIVFVRGTTEGVNLIAQSWGRRNVGEGDEIVLTTLEHHSNIVPWQLLAAEKGAKLRVAPVDDTGQIRLDEYEKLFNARTRLAAFTHVSNALGTITPIAEMVAIAHRHGARTLVDGAQSVSHLPVDVRALDTDFFVFSGHKVYGPTGIGVVYGKPEVLESMPPWQGGGNMIVDVTFDKTVYAPSPARFEAGTGNIADAVGLGAALDWLTALGLPNVARYEHDLLEYAQGCLATVPGLRPVGTAKEKTSVVGFVMDGFRSEEVGAALDREGIAVRSGHHCAQPALRRFGLETSVRPSLAVYNTKDEVDHLTRTLRRLASSRGAR